MIEPTAPMALVAPVQEDASWLDRFAPGLVAGPADDDPGGSATGLRARAQFGDSMLRSLVFTDLLMVATQLILARIGRVSGHGLATNVRRHAPRSLLHGIVALLVIASTIKIAADIAGMADAILLLAGGNAHLFVVLLGVLSVALQGVLPNQRDVRVPRGSTLALLACIGAVLVVHVPWQQVVGKTVLPRITWKAGSITTLVALFGITASPSLFFRRASTGAQERRAAPAARPLSMAVAVVAMFVTAVL